MRGGGLYSRRTISVTVAALAAAVYACSGILLEAPKLPSIEGAEAVGAEACATCHPDIAGSFVGQAHRTMAQGSGSCEACHGNGGKHAESFDSADIRNRAVLVGLDAAQKSQLCLGCHKNDVPAYWSSDHADAGVSCWSCHADALHPVSAREGSAESDEAATWGEVKPIDLHRGRVGSLAQVWPGSRGSEFCYQCHESTENDFLLQFHHPVPEGRMECTDCHSVHGDPVPSLAESGQRCLSCHNEIAGPWVFEHVAMDDGCLSCHAPHGSTVEKMLTQGDNALCEQCHFDARYPLIGGIDHTRLLSGGALCVDCHSQVHGSNTDENLNPLRIEELLRGTRTR